jgi:hypothetical protein
MKTGDCILWSSDTLLGKLIQWKSGSMYNHVSMVIRFNEYDVDRVYVIEALEHGIVLMPLSERLLKHKGTAFHFSLMNYLDNIHLRNCMAKHSLSSAGKDYDYKSLFLNIFGKVSTETSQYFCSEFWFDMLKKASYETDIGSDELLKIHNDLLKGMAPIPSDIPKICVVSNGTKIL